MYGRVPVERARLPARPFGAEEDGGEGLVSVRHQLEKIERVVAAEQKHAAHPESAHDLRPRLRHVDAVDGEVDAVTGDLDVPVAVEAPRGAGGELAGERAKRLRGRGPSAKEQDGKQDGRGGGRSQPHEFNPTRL